MQEHSALNGWEGESECTTVVECESGRVRQETLNAALLSGTTVSNESAAGTGETGMSSPRGASSVTVCEMKQRKLGGLWCADRHWRVTQQERVHDMKIMNSCEGGQGGFVHSAAQRVKGRESLAHLPAAIKVISRQWEAGATQGTWATPLHT